MNEKELRKLLFELADAAKPFIDSNIVTETDGTIPLMNLLEAVLDKVEAIRLRDDR